MKKFLQLDFLPRSSDLALLLLRLHFGIAMIWLHGRVKAEKFSEMSSTFADPLGVGNTTSLVLALLGEIVCPALLVLGLFTRFAALGGAVTMGVAFFIVHKMKLSGPGNGELAFLFFGVFVALFIAGAGRFSCDAKMGAKI